MTDPLATNDKLFVVIADRSSGSVFGAATAPCKSNGLVVRYATLEEAQAAAREKNLKVVSPNVAYYAGRA